MSSPDAEMPSSVRVTFKDALSKSKRVTFSLLLCTNFMCMINEAVKCIWPLYATTNFNAHSTGIGWILFAFYWINICGLSLFSLLNKPSCGHLTSAPIFICLLTAICIFFQANAIKDGQTTSFTQVFILLLCLAFISYHTLTAITIAFSDIVLPQKHALNFKQNTLSPTHLLFTCIGPSVTGLILYTLDNDYYSVFYLLSIAALVLTLLSLLLCGKQQKLESLQSTVKYNDDEHTKLNGNQDVLHEREFPANLNTDDIDESDSNALLALVDISIISIALSSFWCNAAIQVILNWYIYFMQQKYNTAAWISGLQLSIAGICAVCSVFVVNRFNYYRYDHLFQVGHRMYHLIHISFPFIFGAISYFLSYVDDAHIVWYVSIPAGLLMGVFYQYTFAVFWKRMKQHTNANRMKMYYLVLFVANIGASISNLSFGILVNEDLWWFWRIISICFMLEMLTSTAVYIVCCIFRLDEHGEYTWLSGKKSIRTAKSAEANIAADLSSGQMSPPLTDKTFGRWSEDEKWKEDDVVGDMHIAQMRKHLHRRVGSATSTVVSNSLGLLDVDYLPDLFKQQSQNTEASEVDDMNDSVIITTP